MSGKNFKLSIDRCPTHGFYAICVGDGNGGRRLTPSKCCGSWTECKSWSFTPDELLDVADSLTALASPHLTQANHQ